MSESIPIDDEDAEFIDAVEQFTFFDASDSFNSVHSVSLSNSSSLYDPDHINHNSVSKSPDPQPDSQSPPFSAGLRRRRVFSRRNSKEVGLKNGSDCLVDFKILRSDVSPVKNYNFLLNLKDGYNPNEKLNVPRARMSSGSFRKRLTEETGSNSLNSSGVVSLSDDGSVNDRSVIDELITPITGSSFVLRLARLIIKVISLKTSLLVAFVSFPVWLIHSFYMFITEPFAMMRRVKGCMRRRISRFLNFCLGNVKRIVYKLIKRNKSVWKLCMKVGWGVLSAVFVGIVLLGLFVFSFVVGGAIMKCVMEVPVHKIEQLNFDYTVDTPMAFVPIPFCPEPFGLEGNEIIEFENVATMRVIPPDHKLQATVLLTLPESDYNRNLGNFQVRVDFLSSNGKFLVSATQPCAMQFKSWPIRLLMTVFKLAPLITGYSSESQTVVTNFKGYTEREIPTCCVRVMLEPRAEFAKGGGVPEIYTAYVKLESQLPLMKRILWSWKATVFVWTSIMVIATGLVFVLLCCIPWLQLRGGAPLNNTGSR